MTVTIGAVARQTGIAAETLRKWELRYGFPVPLRTESGHRVFHDLDVEKIHDVARAIAQGQRAGEAIKSALVSAPNKFEKESSGAKHVSLLTKAIKLLQADDLSRYQDHLETSLAELGIVAFIQEMAVPLIHEVGALWLSGELQPFREHAFTSHLSGLMVGWSQKLKQHNRQLRPTKAAKPVLLGLPAGEQHYLAVSLMEVMLLECGVPTIAFKSGLPASQIALAAQTYRARAVAISCSEASPKKLLSGELTELRRLLGKEVALWVGGAGAARLQAPIDGIEFIYSMQEVAERALNLGQM